MLASIGNIYIKKNVELISPNGQGKEQDMPTWPPPYSQGKPGLQIQAIFSP